MKKKEIIKKKILFMDDGDMVLEVGVKVLKTLGYDVETANDGSRAIELYKYAKEKGEPFDAIIMDLSIVGGMGGKETITKLLEIDPDTKAIICSAAINDEVMIYYEKYGFKGVIEKPYEIENLDKVIQKVILNP